MEKRKIVLIISIIFFLVIIAIGIEGAMDKFYYPKPFTGQTNCSLTCAKIMPNANAPQITQEELKNGCYYGYQNEKKKNTPDDWIHLYGGTKNAQWCMPTRSSIKQCDCDSR